MTTYPLVDIDEFTVTIPYFHVYHPEAIAFVKEPADVVAHVNETDIIVSRTTPPAILGFRYQARQLVKQGDAIRRNGDICELSSVGSFVLSINGHRLIYAAGTHYFPLNLIHFCSVSLASSEQLVYKQVYLLTPEDMAALNCSRCLVVTDLKAEDGRYALFTNGTVQVEPKEHDTVTENFSHLAYPARVEDTTRRNGYLMADNIEEIRDDPMFQRLCVLWTKDMVLLTAPPQIQLLVETERIEALEMWLEWHYPEARLHWGKYTTKLDETDTLEKQRQRAVEGVKTEVERYRYGIERGLITVYKNDDIVHPK